MAHKQAEGLGRIGVVAFPDHLVEQLALHMVPKGHPYGVVIANAEMVAGDDLAALDGGKILDAPNFLDDQLSLCDHFVKEPGAADIGNLIFDLIGELFIQIVDLIRHKGIGFRVILHIQMPQFFFLQLSDSSEQLQFVRGFFHIA